MNIEGILNLIQARGATSGYRLELGSHPVVITVVLEHEDWVIDNIVRKYSLHMRISHLPRTGIHGKRFNSAGKEERSTRSKQLTKSNVLKFIPAVKYVG